MTVWFTRGSATNFVSAPASARRSVNDPASELMTLNVPARAPASNASSAGETVRAAAPSPRGVADSRRSATAGRSATSGSAKSRLSDRLAIPRTGSRGTSKLDRPDTRTAVLAYSVSNACLTGVTPGRACPTSFTS